MRKPPASPSILGRPSSYTPEIALELFERMASGESMIKITKDLHMPSVTTIHRWILKDESFRKEYAHARELQAEYMAQIINDLAAEAEGKVRDIENPKLANALVSAIKLRVDTYRWTASHLLPKVYGDKMQLANAEGDGPPTIKIEVKSVLDE